MILLTLPYFFVALYLGGTAFWRGEIGLGFAILGASYLATGAGISLRKLLKWDFNHEFDIRKQALLTAFWAGLMLAASLALMHYLEIDVGPIDGMIFALIGVVIGSLSSMSPDAKAGDALPSKG